MVGGVKRTGSSSERTAGSGVRSQVLAAAAITRRVALPSTRSGSDSRLSERILLGVSGVAALWLLGGLLVGIAV